jgi:transposase InsO family protein
MISSEHGQRRAYDHRLREQVCRAGARSLGRDLRIPRSTIASWHRRGVRPVVTNSDRDLDPAQLRARIEKLENRSRVLAAVVRLLLVLLRVSRFKLDGKRLPDGDDKAAVLRSIDSTQPILPLATILRIVRLSPSRYHAWRRAGKTCGLQDRNSCPRTTPRQLTPAEIAAIKDMVLDPEYRHMPLRTLCLFAQRIGKVLASVTTWAILVREHGWRRPRLRVHPDKPEVGVRAAEPNEFWHLDVTVVKLVDGVKVYLHAVIDNFSRKILAWFLAENLEPQATSDLLIEASRFLDAGGARPTVVADSGVENVNSIVDRTLASSRLRRVLAQVEVTFSNSMIEAFWRSLKHQWLYLSSLDSIETVRELVAFFVEQHNTKMPHAAFNGHTPDEMYFGTAPNLGAQLAAARASALAARLAANRAASCSRCTPHESPELTEIPP